MKLNTLSNILNFIPKTFQKDLEDPDQWKSWAFQSLRTAIPVGGYELRERRIAILTIEDHKVELPKGLQKIISLKQQFRNPNEEELTSLDQCVKYDGYKDRPEKDSCETVDCKPCDPTDSLICEKILPDGTVEKKTIHYSNNCLLQHKLFLHCNYYRNCFVRMKYVGRVSKEYFTRKSLQECRTAVNRGYNRFSISGDCLTTDLKSGIVCMEYEANITNEEGDLLVPANPIEMWQGMANYAISQYFLNKTLMENSRTYSNLHEKHLSMSSNLMKQVKGIFKMKAICFSTHMKIYNSQMYQLTQLPATWPHRQYHYRTYFNHYGE